ncbi:MAG: DNA repair protein RecN, partial [Clostridia bacterium]|nr:DNA repair protein RecN [Clostridia bacterium]
LLYGGTGETSAYDLISRAVAQLVPLQSIDPALVPVVEALQEVAFLLEDKAAFLRDYRQHLDFSPGRLGEVQSRLHLIKQLRRKYGGGVEEVLRRGEELKRRLAAAADRSEKLAQAAQELAARERDFHELAASLSVMRREAARRLESEITAVLEELAMPQTVFLVLLRQTAPGATGTDEVEFHFSANPGEPPRPVARIASGGELSRLMLALKSIMAEHDAIPTLIFDEIDAGLGGGAARAVGEKLRHLSRWHQVICVTHAAQIAACAERHFHLTKEEHGGRTVTRIRLLDEEGRVRELARMLAGRVDQAALNHARQMLGKGA